MALVSSIAAACTTAVAEDTTQCRSQADCLARGPEFADTTCTEQRTCEKIPILAASCATNQECIDRNGGAAFTCRKSDGRCVALTSPNCQTVIADKEDLLNDETIFIGAIAPLNDDGRMMQFALSLARQEIKAAGSLAAATPEGPRRPLGIVSCLGEVTSPQIAQTQIDHLSKTLKVPFLIGPVSPQRATQVLTQAITFDMAAITTSSAGFINDLADKDLVFRQGYNEDQYVKAIGPFVKDVLEPQMLIDGVGPIPNTKIAGEPTRVAILQASDIAGIAQTQAVVKTLTINGKPATDPDNAANFQIIDIGDLSNPVNHPNPDAERNIGVAKAVKFKPHVVIFGATPLPFNMAWVALNRAWPAGTAKPYTISIAQAVPGNILNAATTVNNDEARRKYFGLRSFSPDRVAADFDVFTQGLRLAFPDATSLPTSNTYGFYDATYMFAYSLAAIKNAPVKGPELARGLRKIATTGSLVKWGPLEYSKGLALIAGGTNIQYFGVQGSYIYDEKGDHPLSSEMACMTAKGGKAASVVSSGWAYDVSAGSGGGVVSCPSN
jgi:hypothetical protein